MSGEDAREAAMEAALLKSVRELDEAIKARVAVEIDDLFGPADDLADE